MTKKHGRTPSNKVNLFFLLFVGLILFLFFNFLSRLAKPQIQSPKFVPSSGLYLYETKNPIFSAKVGSKDTKAPYVVFNSADSTASFTLNQSSSQKIIQKDNQIIFEKAKENTDVVYHTLPNGLKEEIVLSGPIKDNEFLFTLVTNNAQPKLIGTNSYSPYFFDNQGNYQFHLEKPFAVDAKGSRTEDITFSLRKSTQNDHLYELRFNVSAKWLTDKNRAYPIIIDPTILHDTSAEFAAGTLNRVKDLGSGSSPSLEAYYQEMASDIYTSALWHMNENSSTTIADSSGNGFTGNFGSTTASPSWTTSTPLGASAVSFDGGDTISVADTAGSALDFTNNFTLEAWIYPTSVANAINQIFIKNNANTNYYGIFIDNAQKLACQISGTTANGLTSVGTIPLNQWTHVACSYDGAYMRLYLNGVLDSAIASTGTTTVNDAALGIGYDSVNSGRTYTGRIDELRISRTVRSPEEIRLDAQRRPYGVLTSDVLDSGTTVTVFNSLSWTKTGVTTGDGETLFDSTSLIAQWNLNETSGTSANNDAEGSSCGGTPANCDGTLSGFDSTASQDADPDSSWTSNNRRWGVGALQFDGLDSVVSVGSDASLQTTGDFSLESWFKTSDAATSRPILSYGTTNDWLYYFGTNPNVLTCKIYQANSATNYLQAISPSTVADGRWHYGVCTVSGTTVSLYVDGFLVATDTTTSGSRDVSSAGTLTIGKFTDASSLFFKGVLDSTRIYSRVLTLSEIISNYNAGLIEFQTRVGTDNSPDDGNWEQWRPVVSETVIDNMDNPIDYATPSASIYVGSLVATSSSTLPLIEGTYSLKIQSGRQTSLTNVVGMWHLDETSGTGAYIKDSTGVNDGTPTGTTTITGVSDKAKLFDDVDDIITISDNDSLDLTTNGTIEAWIKTNANEANNWFICKSGNYCLGVNATGAFLFTGASAQDNAGTSLQAGSWHHVAITSNNTTVTYYVDGASAGTDSVAWGSTLTNSLIFGSDGGTNFFDGDIDEVRISNVVRSPEEIAESYRMGRDYFINKTLSNLDLSGKTSLPFYVAASHPGTYLEAVVGESSFANYQSDANTLGLWHLSEQSGVDGYLKDSSGHGYHATPTGTTFSTGRIGNGRKFNGTSDVLTLTGEGANFSVDTFTISAWIYESADSGVVRSIFDNRDGANDGSLMNIDANDNISCSYNAVTAISTTTISTGHWYHIACVSDGSSLQVYVNGQLENSSAVTGNISETADAVISGRSFSTQTNFFSGSIDEIRFDNTARTADAIRQAFEYDTRAHDITIDFAASLDSGNLIANSGDLSFTIDATTEGLNNKGSNLFKGDKIIVKENVDGTEYLAQGSVTAIALSSGDTTVASWDAGSTFPTGGFTTKASVFKWQREYWDIRKPLDSQINDITLLTLRIMDGNVGHNIWLDDLRSKAGYLTNSAGSSPDSSTGRRYFQYRALIRTSDTNVSPSLSQVLLDYTANTPPNTPTLDSPTDAATGVTIVNTQLKTTATDPDSDYLRYKIQICSDLSMSLSCQTFDESASPVGWVGQNTQGNTAYTSGTQAIYVPQTPLSANSTYYWRSYAIDPAGTNTYSGTQSPPHSFTTSVVPDIPTLDSPTDGATGVSSTTAFKTTANDSDLDYLKYKIQICTNDAMTANCQTFNQVTSGTGWSGMDSQGNTAYQSGTQASYTVQTPLVLSTTYFWRSYAIDPGGTNTFSGTQASPFSFTTINAPPAPSQCVAIKNANNTQIVVNWVDNATSENGYQVWRVVNGAAPVQLGSNLPADTVTVTDSTVSNGNSYGYKIRAFQTDGSQTNYSNFCSTATLNLNTGDFFFEGIKFN